MEASIDIDMASIGNVNLVIYNGMIFKFKFA